MSLDRAFQLNFRRSHFILKRIRSSALWLTVTGLELTLRHILLIHNLISFVTVGGKDVYRKGQGVYWTGISE